MFQTDDTTSLLQPGIDEALACRDLLAPAPVQPSRTTRLRRWMAVTRRREPVPSVLALVLRLREHPLPLQD
ncbi:MAG: hypothetical protein M3Q71_13230 [Chloroflexota bacterium]|nr:hypothetical protein [Chloroflexota bacterium]